MTWLCRDTALQHLLLLCLGSERGRGELKEGGGGKEGKEEERCYESSEYDGQWYVFSRASHFTVNFKS